LGINLQEKHRMNDNKEKENEINIEQNRKESNNWKDKKSKN